MNVAAVDLGAQNKKRDRIGVGIGDRGYQIGGPRAGRAGEHHAGFSAHEGVSRSHVAGALLVAGTDDDWGSELTHLVVCGEEMSPRHGEHCVNARIAEYLRDHPTTNTHFFRWWHSRSVVLADERSPLISFMLSLSGLSTYDIRSNLGTQPATGSRNHFSIVMHKSRRVQSHSASSSETRWLDQSASGTAPAIIQLPAKRELSATPPRRCRTGPAARA